MQSRDDTVVRKYRPAPDAQPVDAPHEDMRARGELREIGGRRDGTEPTRYGDWEKHGRCIDF